MTLVHPNRLCCALACCLLVSFAFGLGATENECAQTAHMQIYSVTSVSKETGDLDGYELALDIILRGN